jgi:glycogen(starch) synthase
MGRMLRTAQAVATCSESVLEDTLRQVPEIRARALTIANRMSAPAVDPAPLPAEPSLLCVGRLVPQKGFDVAIDAFAELALRFPRLRLRIAGDGICRVSLKEQAERLGLRDRVDFLCWVLPDSVPSLMNAVSIVVMPSRIEPFGLVAPEAAHMARPIVASATGGAPEVVHGETGLLVRPKDAGALASAIGYLLDHPEEAACMANAARTRAR